MSLLSLGGSACLYRSEQFLMFFTYIFEFNEVEQPVVPPAVRQLEVLAMPEGFAVACLKSASSTR